MTDYQRALNELQDEVGSWSRENFGDQSAANPLLGGAEEMGELHRSVLETCDVNGAAPRSLTAMLLTAKNGELIHSVLKRRQGIRGDEAGVGDEAEQEKAQNIHDLLHWLEEAENYPSNLDEILGDTDEKEELDAVGDIIVYLADFCERRGINLGDAVSLAWDGEVKDREWDSTYTEDN